MKGGGVVHLDVAEVAVVRDRGKTVEEKVMVMLVTDSGSKSEMEKWKFLLTAVKTNLIDANIAGRR